MNMQKIRSFLLFFLGLLCFNTGFADESIFQMDQDLVNKLRDNKVRLIVMRQAEANNNTKKIVTSERTPGFCLTTKGHMQLYKLAPFFSAQNVSKIFTSPLYRCLQSTQMLGDQLDLPIDNLVVDDRLAIQNFGLYERYHYNIYNGFFSSLTDMLEAELPYMESGVQVFRRTNDFLWHVADNVFDKTILIMTHAFNYCHISKCLTDEYGKLPHPGDYEIYDFSEESMNP